LDKLLVGFYGPLPTGIFQSSHIFVIADNFTRFVKLYPLDAPTQKYISKNQPQIISPTMVSRKILYQIAVDNSSVNIGKLPSKNIKCPIPASTLPNQTQQSGSYENLVECSVLTATNNIPSVLFLQNSQHNPITQFVHFPNENYPTDFNKQLTLAQEVQLSKSEYRKKYQQERLNPTFFKMNDLVLVRTHKLSNKINKKIFKFFLLYDGPFKVKSIENVNAYELVHPEDDTPQGTHNISQLKPYIPPIV